MAIVAPSLPSASADSFTITNRSQHPITTTCSSKDDHLGTHDLIIGEERAWHFNGSPSTKFWCNFYKSDGKYLDQVVWSLSFNYVFHSSTIDLIWELKEAGIFLENGSKENLFRGWSDVGFSPNH
ncbi:hypothetical protein O6H91_02G001300 [Diphasiastrum complanatum]|uniref:Uncharacterized protein n=1 Tax=Diphasiastrum complanatum TaxID=34168 RepID=A0ACC2EBT4_DIPCM|nr:hypothetical protein O6H91_02G001300 [Diphasiastrum complanatum]